MGKNLPDWVVRWKTRGVEIQRRKGRFYAYRITSRWDPEKKRAQKVTLEYLGVVTPGGIKKARDTPRRYSVYEFGTVELIERVCGDVKGLVRDHFPGEWREIFSMAVLYVLYQPSLRTAKPLFEKTYLMKRYPEARLSTRYLSKMYCELGLRWSEQLGLMRELLVRSEYLAVDMSFIFSESEKIRWLEHGYNSKGEYHRQLNILLAFSLDKKEPAYIRVLPGSIRDVSTVRRLVEEMPEGVRLVVITDKGFYSEGNILLLEDNHLLYVVPLRRDLKIIRYPHSYESYFKFRDRNIMYHSYPVGDRRLIVYFDPRLGAEEENTYLDLISAGKRDMEGFKVSRERFGTLAILTNVDKKPEEVYSLYKQRSDIEEVLDVLMNVLNADRSYLRTVEHVRGYMFVMLISLIIYYRLLNTLRKAGLINVVSVKEMLVNLSKVCVVEDKLGKEFLSEVPKKARTILEKMKIDLLLKTEHQ
jgi:transposase